MSIFDNYSDIGKNNIKARSSDLLNMVGEEGLRDIVKKIFLGGNIRDITEFITQKRLINSYFAMLDLYVKHLSDSACDTDKYVNHVIRDLAESVGDARTLDLWLLGMTNKGLDNIVRTKEKIMEYQYAFLRSLNEAIDEIKSDDGELKGIIEIGGRSMQLNRSSLSLLFLAIGAQTLSIRGSAKSMNGKMFEKLILGSLFSVMGFEFLPGPPERIDRHKKLFWLSHIDENERETDATAIYNGKAVSIDIGFIGKGNPEISLDKVTRFAAYKRIGRKKHNMFTIIIVDTVPEKSGLIHKANRLNAEVLQMKDKNWTIKLARVICKRLQCKNTLSTMKYEKLDDYFKIALNGLDMQRFINEEDEKRSSHHD